MTTMVPPPESKQLPQNPMSGATGRAAVRGLAIGAAILLIAGAIAELLHVQASICMVLRWCGFALFVPFAMRRRSLLLWTFYAMVAGAELGVDAPHFATQMQFVAEIFLRLIRMIVAPLVFG